VKSSAICQLKPIDSSSPTNGWEHLLVSEFRIRDRQIESIGMMLLAELQQNNLGGRLYNYLLNRMSCSKTFNGIYPRILAD
jgi:hypothetical protein